MPKKSKPQQTPPDLPSPPTQINPYEVLSVPVTATSAEIRSAYRKLALTWHPDKHSDKPLAHTKFQEIAFAYAVLSDDVRRRRYDDTGRLTELDGEGEFDWKEYFEGLWRGVVSGETIREFTEKYQGESSSGEVDGRG
jgi:DnaJ homolog subfamily C member 9